MGGGHLHYRFGKLGHPAIDIVNAPDWSNVHISQWRGKEGAIDNQIRFTNGKTHYIIHAGAQGDNANYRPGAHYSELSAEQGENRDKMLAVMQCDFDGWHGHLDERMPKIRDSLGNGPLDEPKNSPFKQ